MKSASAEGLNCLGKRLFTACTAALCDHMDLVKKKCVFWKPPKNSTAAVAALIVLCEGGSFGKCKMESETWQTKYSKALYPQSVKSVSLTQFNQITLCCRDVEIHSGSQGNDVTFVLINF